MRSFLSLDRQVAASKLSIQSHLEDDTMRKSRSIETSLSSFTGSRICVCSPTNHPGSFRCRHHRNPPSQGIGSGPSTAHSPLRSQAAQDVDLVSMKIEGVEGK